MTFSYQTLDWRSLVAPGVIQTNRGGLLSAFRWTPQDHNALTRDLRMGIRSIQNRALMSLGHGYAVLCTKRKRKTTHYPDADFQNPTAQYIDSLRRSNFTSGVQYRVDHYISLLAEPAGEQSSFAAKLFGEAPPEAKTPKERLAWFLSRYDERLKEFAGDMEASAVEIERLEESDLLTFLFSFVTEWDNTQRVMVPEIPEHLHHYLAADDPIVPGYRARIGKDYVRVMWVRDEPNATHPQVLAALDDYPGEYTASAMWVPYSPQAAKGHLSVSVRNLMTSLSKNKDPSLDAVRRSAEAQAMEASISAGTVGGGEWSFVVEVRGTARSEVDDKFDAIRKILRAKDFIASDVGDRFLSHWLSTVPVHPRSEVGRWYGSSAKFSDILPGHTVWTGPSWNKQLNAGPVLVTKGKNGTSFNLMFHHGDNDTTHVQGYGGSGSGKTTLINALIPGWLAYRNSQVFVIAKKAGTMVTTLCLDGAYNALGVGKTDATPQPYARIHVPQEMAWAFSWTMEIIKAIEPNVSPSQQGYIKEAMQNLASMPMHLRTISALKSLVQDNGIKKALGVYCGTLLDHANHSVPMERVTCFETLALGDDKLISGPLLGLIFHEIWLRCDGKRPTLFIIDEAGMELQHPVTVAEFKKFAALSRYAGVTMMFFTQNVGDVPDSLKETVNNQFPFRIFCSTPGATAENVAKHFRAIQVNDERIEKIATGRPKRDYFFEYRGAFAQFSLDLTDEEKPYVTRTSLEDTDAALAIREAGWSNEAWLDYCNGGSRFRLAAE